MKVQSDLNLLGIIVLNVWVPITHKSNDLVDDHHKTKLPGIISWSIIKLVYVFESKYNPHVFKNFDCPTAVISLLFA